MDSGHSTEPATGRSTKTEPRIAAPCQTEYDYFGLLSDFSETIPKKEGLRWRNTK